MPQRVEPGDEVAHLPIGLDEGLDAFEDQQALVGFYGLLQGVFVWRWRAVGRRVREAEFKAAEEVLPLFWERAGVALVLLVERLDVFGVFTVRSK